MRELCRIQTFPDDVRITGSRTEMQRQVGNAVPSLLGEVLARTIGAQFLGLKYKRPPRLLPPDRSPTPAAERVCPVPQKFRELIGDHSPHPGTGLGNAALIRAEAAAHP